MNNKTTKDSSTHLSVWGGNLKSVNDEGVLEGNGIVFGSEDKPDASSFKDFFTQDTFVHPDDSFVTTLFMEHGLSYAEPIGKALIYRTDDGWDVTAELNLQDPVVKSRFSEIKDGGWGFSTGAVGHVVKRDEKSNGTHHIKQWVVGEISITKTPAEPTALVRSVKSLEDYYGTPFMGDPQSSDGSQVDDMPDMSDMIEEMVPNNSINEKLVEIILMLIQQLNQKSQIFIPELKEIKTLLSELNQKNTLNSNELTVLESSEYSDLKNMYDELQSSFGEQEALLSDQMALLSELQEDNQVKSESLNQLENTVKEKQDLILGLEQKLKTQREVNRLLSRNFNK